MKRWNNDYNQSAHPSIIAAISELEGQNFPGYGTDNMCEKAKAEIRKYIHNENADIHFLVGGTQTNYIVIASALRPYQGIISAATGHISLHETGAIENTGHKVITIEGKNGKLDASMIEEIASEYDDCGIKEHIVMPKMVFLSFPSEYGTIYSKEELINIRKVCDKYNLYLYIDGARLGYGLGADECDVTLEDICNIADVFYIGGTKCGALFGEAVVILNDCLKEGFRNHMKQNGALLAKGWLLGVQYYELFKDGLYFDITKHADTQAMRIKKAFSDNNIPFAFESFTNQQFVILTNEQMEKIGKNNIFEYDSKIDDNHHVIRFCTSWATKISEVDELIEEIKEL